MRSLSGLFITAALLFGNEVEHSAEEVNKLRQNYRACQAELAASEKKILLLTHSLNETRAKNIEYKQRIQVQQAQLSELDEQKSGGVQKIFVSTDPKLCPDSSPFPKLLMKEAYQTMKANGTLKENGPVTVNGVEADAAKSGKRGKVSSKRVVFKPRTFSMKQEAKVYDAPDGKVIAIWEASTSFTSGEKQNGWIRITGYFVDEKWHPNRGQTMWVKEQNTIRR